MEKGQLWTIVGVALVVAVVASIVTASITGNVINVAKGRAGTVYTTAETYSKAEVDTKIARLNNVSINWNTILNNLNNKCYATSFTNMFGTGLNQTCNQLCGNHNEKCIGGSFEEMRFENGKRYTAYSGTLNSCDYQMYPSSFNGTTSYTCICCSL